MNNSSNSSSDNNKIYTQKEFAKIMRVTVDTVKMWRRKGKITPKRYPSGRPFYTQEMIDEILKGKH